MFWNTRCFVHCTCGGVLDDWASSNFVNKTKLLLWTFKPHNKTKPYLYRHFFKMKKAPLIARILRLSCRYCFPVHQWSIALIYEWLVDFSHFWYNSKLSKYNEREATWRQEGWCNWIAQNDWPGSEICEIWTQKPRPIPSCLGFAFLHISPLKIISINGVTSWTEYPYCFFSLK